MWAFAVPVMDELLMSWKHPRLANVRLMERLNLSDRRRPPHACHDMLNPVSTAELRELRPASSGRVELGSPVGEDLLGLPVLVDRFLEQVNRMRSCRVVMNSRAWKET